MEEFDEEFELSDSEEWYDYAMDKDETKKRKKRSKNIIFQLHEIGSSSKNSEERSLPVSFRTIHGKEEKDAIKEDVLPYLPAKVLTRLKTVSKNWDSWIKSPFLSHRQSYSFHDISGFFYQFDDAYPTFISMNHASYGVPSPTLAFMHHAVDILASTHGLLVCQARSGKTSYYVCNPANKDYKELPKPEYFHGFGTGYVLAFDPSLLNMGAHYQLVCAVPLIDQPVVLFEIYSSETNSWRCPDLICVELGGDFKFTGNGFYMKGVAFCNTTTKKVLAFDTKNETYRILSLPNGSPPDGVLTSIHGEVCYIGMSKKFGGETKEYIVKIYHGMDLNLRETLVLDFEMAPRGGFGVYHRVLPYFNDDMLMVVLGRTVYGYSLTKGRIGRVYTHGFQFLSTTRFLPYVNSLVRVS